MAVYQTIALQTAPLLHLDVNSTYCEMQIYGNNPYKVQKKLELIFSVSKYLKNQVLLRYNACWLVKSYPCFRTACSLNNVSHSLFTIQHSVISHRTWIFINTMEKTSIAQVWNFTDITKHKHSFVGGEGRTQNSQGCWQ